MSELAKQAGQLFESIAGPVAKEIGEMIRDELRPYRAARQAKLAEKTARMVQEGQYVPRVVPPRLLVGIFENAGLEDDEDLHSMWAALLANAANPGATFTIRVAFIEILRQLEPQEAKFLDGYVWNYVSSYRASKSKKEHHDSSYLASILNFEHEA